MIGAMIGSFFGGFYVGQTQVGAYSPGAPNIFNLAVYVGKDFNNIRDMVIGCVITLVVAFVVTIIIYHEHVDYARNDVKIKK